MGVSFGALLSVGTKIINVDVSFSHIVLLVTDVG
jgi:hypothetical protein